MKYLFILILILSQSCTKKVYEKVKQPDLDYEQIPCYEEDNLILTVYYPVEEQCNGDYLHTADNEEIDLSLLKERKIRWVALSRDLLDKWGGKYSYGDTINISCNDSNIRGHWVVHDTMNKRYKNRVDVLFYPDQYLTKIDNVLISKI